MRGRRLASVCVLALLVVALAPAAARAVALPAGFQESVVWSGLTYPTNIEFAPDGRVFVAEKSGVIKVFDSPTDPTPTVFADLSANVHDFWDRGMLGMAVDPRPAPATPYVYVLYTYDAPIGGTPPTFGDGCPNPPGATADGCVVSAGCPA
jgi:glucose/arabinose dehydrogenase